MSFQTTSLTGPTTLYWNYSVGWVMETLSQRCGLPSSLPERMYSPQGEGVLLTQSF